MAEAIFNSLVTTDHIATSAGTKVGEFEGQKLKDYAGAARALAALQEIGIDWSGHERNQVTPAMADEADKVIVMAEPETIPQWLSEHSKFTYWEIMDAWDEEFSTVQNIRNIVKAKVGELVRELRAAATA